MSRAKQNERYMDLDTLYKRRSFLGRERIKLENSFDKYLLTFSTGALYLSVIFSNNAESELKYTYILGVGWALLFLCIVATLRSIILSEKSFAKEVEITDEKIEELINNKKKVKRKINPWNEKIDVLQNFIVGFFVFGLFTLSIFYYINIKNIDREIKQGIGVNKHNFYKNTYKKNTRMFYLNRR